MIGFKSVTIEIEARKIVEKPSVEDRHVHFFLLSYFSLNWGFLY